MTRAWAETVGLAGLGGGDQRRVEAAQRTCVRRWLAVLWKQRETRTESSPPSSTASAASRARPRASERLWCSCPLAELPRITTSVADCEPTFTTRTLIASAKPSPD